MATRKPITSADGDDWEPHLGYLFPRVQMLRADQIATPLGVDLRTVSRLFDVEEIGTTGKRRPWLHGIEFNAGAEGARMTRRYPRDSAILFYISQANYVPADVLQLLFDVLENRTPAELVAIQQRAAQLLKR